MTNTKHDEEIKELCAFFHSYIEWLNRNNITPEKAEIQYKVFSTLLSEYSIRAEVINTRDGTIKQLQKHNTKLANENEKMRKNSNKIIQINTDLSSKNSSLLLKVEELQKALNMMR